MSFAWLGDQTALHTLRWVQIDRFRYSVTIIYLFWNEKFLFMMVASYAAVKNISKNLRFYDFTRKKKFDMKRFGAFTTTAYIIGLSSFSIAFGENEQRVLHEQKNRGTPLNSTKLMKPVPRWCHITRLPRPIQYHSKTGTATHPMPLCLVWMHAYCKPFSQPQIRYHRSVEFEST